jgi:hypothetical protein
MSPETFNLWVIAERRVAGNILNKQSRTADIKKNMEPLIDASKEVGLEVNTEKTKYMLLSRHQNAGQSDDIKIANKCFENVT